jgi:hypothetical protein
MGKLSTGCLSYPQAVKRLLVCEVLMLVSFRTYGTLRHKGKLLSVWRKGEGPYQSILFSVAKKQGVRNFSLSEVASDDRAYMREALLAEEYYQAQRAKGGNIL